MFFLRGGLDGDFVWNGFVGPNLGVRMGVAGAHDFTAIFEDLDVADPGDGGEGGVFAAPELDDFFDLPRGHAAEGQAVLGGVAEDAADAGFGLGAEELGVWLGRKFLLREEGGEIIFEGECFFVIGVDLAVGAGVAGAKVASGIVGAAIGGGRRFLLALPGPVIAVGRDEDPAAREGIPAAVDIHTVISEAPAAGRQTKI